MRLRNTALIIAALTIIPLAANAGGHTADKFMKADTDNSGSVSKAEFTTKYEDKFTKMDGDASGDVTAEEYETYIHSKHDEYIKEKFEKMDADGDGMVSMEELSEYKHSHKKDK